MRHLGARQVILLALLVLLTVGASVFFYRCLGNVGNNPHGPNAKHPKEVTRIMKLLPEIPATASYDEIIARLGLSKDRSGGSVSSTHCTMTWEITPDYRFALSFDPVSEGDKLVLVFVEASFSATRKPGFPSHEYHTVYPYRNRTWKGMVNER